MLAKCGVQVSMTDLFGVGGHRAAGPAARCPAPYAARIASLRRVIDDLDFEIDLFAGMVRGRLARDPGYRRGPARSPGSGRSWARCSSPRSVTSPGSPAPRSWPAGPG